MESSYSINVLQEIIAYYQRKNEVVLQYWVTSDVSEYYYAEVVYKLLNEFVEDLQQNQTVISANQKLYNSILRIRVEYRQLYKSTELDNQYGLNSLGKIDFKKRMNLLLKPLNMKIRIGQLPFSKKRRLWVHVFV